MTRTAVPISTFGGRLIQLSIHAANAVEIDFDLYQHATNGSLSVDNIYKVVGAVQQWQREQHDIRFRNSDSPPTTNLYLEVTNTDTVTATGVITLQLYIRAPGSGA
jgi:hypothetical protein